MTNMKKLLGLSLSFALSTAFAAVPVSATEEPASLGELLFSIDSLLSVEETEVSLAQYRQNSRDNQLFLGDSWSVTTAINHLAPDANLQIQSYSDGLWVYVQYFTDIDGDGVYEVPSTVLGTPLWDVLVKSETLYAYDKISNWQTMGDGTSREISMKLLLEHAFAEEFSRSPEGGSPISQLNYENSGDFIFCITLTDQSFHDTLSSVFNPNDLPSYYLKADLLGWSDPTLTGAYTFTDVTPWDWYYEGVDSCVRAGLFRGTKPSLFSPDDTMTRAMALQTLYSLAGYPDSSQSAFEDVPEDAWYSSALSWAVQKKIATAEGNLLRPEENVTRQELVNFLYQYALSYGGFPTNTSTNLSRFPDSRLVSSVNTKALIWATEYGLVGGDDAGYLRPTETATRGQVATILNQFMELAAE